MRNGGSIQLHIVVMGYGTGEPAVLLVEREPRLVEFPLLRIEEEELSDEERLISRIAEETGLDVVIEGYLEQPLNPGPATPNSRFLVVRSLGGTPELSGEAVGWEWRPAAGLLGMQFVPNEARTG